MSCRRQVTRGEVVMKKICDFEVVLLQLLLLSRVTRPQLGNPYNNFARHLVSILDSGSKNVNL